MASSACSLLLPTAPCLRPFQENLQPMNLLKCRRSSPGCSIPQKVRRHSMKVRSQEGDKTEVAEQDKSTDQQKKPVSSPPKVEKGQTTAIVTGAISIIFGVLYLVLVQLLDSRGNQLLPPPPEAFGL